MGLLNKIKDILFEDEEVEEIEKKKDDKRIIKPQDKPIVEKVEPQKRNEFEDNTPPVREQPKTTFQPKKEEMYNTVNERELFKSENTFPFPDFDEEEFSTSMSRQQRQKSPTNVLEYEKKKKTERKFDLGRYERIETREVVEKKKFKPSPIISPVYGILNEDYKIEDIKDKTEVNNSNTLDFSSVRKKAFGEIESLEAEPKETFYEETVTVKLQENPEEKKQKEKTIDELLEDTADVKINLDSQHRKEQNIDEYDKIDEDLEEIIESSPKKENIQFEDDDTLENDLFDLIDSMYDNREDGE